MRIQQLRPSLLATGFLALALALAAAPSANAQQTRFISDEVFIVLHAGPGSNYRWLAKLQPGTRLEEMRLSNDGNWAEVRTERGTEGWVQAEYLASEPPAQVRLPAVVRQLEDAERDTAEMQSVVSELRGERDALQAALDESRLEFQRVSEELAQLRQVSGSAIETAENNRRLVEEAASMRMNLDTMSADNQRLQDRVRSSAFMDGALAVMLGVIITLVVPRLWPKRRNSSSWA